MASAIAANGGRPAAAVLDDVLPPALGVVVPGAGRRAASGPASDRRRAASGRRPRCLLAAFALARSPALGRPASELWAAGRSQKRTGTPAAERAPDRLPLGREHGERPERGPPLGSPAVGTGRRAAPPAAPCLGSPASATSASASGGPSMSTTSGWQRVQRAPRTRPGRARPVVPDPEDRTQLVAALATQRPRGRPGRSRSSPSRSRTTVSRYSCQTTRSDTGSLHHRADDAGGHVGGPQHAVAEVGGQREAVGDHRDRLGGATACPLGDLSLVRPSSVTPGAQLAEDGDHPADLLQRRRVVGQLQRPAELRRPGGRRCRPPPRPWPGSGSTTVLNRRRSALDSSLTPRSRSLAVAMTLKPLRACTSVPSSGIGSVFSDRIGDQRVLHVGRDAGQLLDPGDRARRPSPASPGSAPAPSRTGPRRAAGRSSSRSGSPPRRCPPCPARAASSRR